MHNDSKWPLFSRLVLPYTRLELPAWGRLMAAAGVYRDHLWANMPRQTVRGKYHGYLMELDLSDRLDRTAYFLGRFYDLGTQLFLKQSIRPGDTFVDVGANIGMITLLAARLVSTEGVVVAIEPNVDVYRRLRSNIEINRLENITLEAVGFSDAATTRTLRVCGNNKGWGTFGTLSANELRQVTAEYQSRTVKGDEILDIPGGRPLMIKIDVEGYECHALRGLDCTIRRHRPAVITEVLGSTLERAQASPEELFAIMHGHGYRAYALELERCYFKYEISLRPITAHHQTTAPNVVWLHPESVHLNRIPSRTFHKRCVSTRMRHPA